MKDHSGAVPVSYYPPPARPCHNAMPDATDPPTLLQQLDDRQNEVLKELDQLNARIEELIREFAQEKTSSILPSKAA